MDQARRPAAPATPRPASPRRARPASRCIQTAVTSTASKRLAARRARAPAPAGCRPAIRCAATAWSFIGRPRASRRPARPPRPRWPIAAKCAASRPVPAPISSRRDGRRRDQERRPADAALLGRDALVGLEQRRRFLRIARGARRVTATAPAPRASSCLRPPARPRTRPRSCQSAIQRWNRVTSSVSMSWKQRPRSADDVARHEFQPVGQAAALLRSLR